MLQPKLLNASTKCFSRIVRLFRLATLSVTIAKSSLFIHWIFSLGYNFHHVSDVIVASSDSSAVVHYYFGKTFGTFDRKLARTRNFHQIKMLKSLNYGTCLSFVSKFIFWNNFVGRRVSVGFEFLTWNS